VAQNFNDFFIKIGPSFAEKIRQSSISYKEYLDKIGRNQHSMFILPTDEAEILKIVRNMKPKTSCGFDVLSPNLIKRVIQPLLLPLKYLLNASLEQGVVPQKMKIAKVTPIFKQGARDQYNNYRPVSVLPTFSKILERIMYDRVFLFIQKNNILAQNQYGFRKGFSTEDAVIEMQARILEHLGKREWCLGVCMDLSKAFDTLDHAILLHKLEHYGLRGLPLKWFKSYLSGRKQYTYIEELGVSSDVDSIQCGVPQGSILGPLLYLLYANDISKCTDNVDLVLFADDTNLLFHDKDINNLKEKSRCLNSVYDWLSANRLSLNIQKTQYIIFHTQQRQSKSDLDNISIEINGISLKRTQSTKFLGIIIDENLTWKDHKSQVCTKIGKMVALLQRLKNIIPKQTLKCLYTAFIQPYLQCGILSWGSSNNDRIFLLQKRAVRLVSGAKYKSHTDPIFKRLGILKINDIYKLKLSKLYNKIMLKIASPYIMDCWVTHLQQYEKSTNLRKINKMHLPPVSIDLQKQNCMYSLIKFVNSDLFRENTQQVKQLLFEQYYSECTINNCYVCNNNT
jgi:hypothetical protein